MNRRLKVLVSAYACSPIRGSEDGVGWGWIKSISRYHDVYVITAAYHRRDIEAAIAKSAVGHSRIYFHYVPHKPWHYEPSKGWLLIENSMLKPIMNLAYKSWQRDAYSLAKEIHKKFGFNLVHQLT